MRIVLVGGGGHASDILGVFEALSRASDIIGIVADTEIEDTRFMSRNVRQIGDVSDLKNIDATHYIVAIGFSEDRKRLHQRVADCGLPAATIIHPLADVPPSVSIGDGSVILSGVRISPLVTVGRHVYLSHGCLIGHDCFIGDFATVLPGAAVSGDAVLGDACQIGSNAVVIERVSIGDNAVVGAGSVVLRDVRARHTVVGNPARPVKGREKD